MTMSGDPYGTAHRASLVALRLGLRTQAQPGKCPPGPEQLENVVAFGARQLSQCHDQRLHGDDALKIDDLDNRRIGTAVEYRRERTGRNGEPISGLDDLGERLRDLEVPAHCMRPQPSAADGQTLCRHPELVRVALLVEIGNLQVRESVERLLALRFLKLDDCGVDLAVLAELPAVDECFQR